MPSPRWDADLLRATTVERLSAGWRSATPFPHLVWDEVLAQEALEALVPVLDEEPVDAYEGDIFAFEATAPEPRTAELRALRDDFAASLAPVMARITGTAVTRADLRAYAYREGHYLLPHTDHQQDLARALAYAYYLPSPEPPRGGELELFRCTIDGAGAVIATDSARVIEPRPNRLVVFEVSDASLHQVREVVSGLRMSLAGWFYP
ncbi:MAG TPA: 2OG-Fe(II) oxygenase [Kofleriaceae bacterium]|nr:2OG-Fe(II) oxygenase [Kofleriaceae bacterium]